MIIVNFVISHYFFTCNHGCMISIVLISTIPLTLFDVLMFNGQTQIIVLNNIFFLFLSFFDKCIITRTGGRCSNFRVYNITLSGLSVSVFLHLGRKQFSYTYTLIFTTQKKRLSKL